MAKTLSVCFMVKNEEKHLGRALASIQHIADEIIVVDTGSSDNTIQIAEDYGAKILFYEWDYDFSSARNKGLEAASMDWILVLDADEELSYEEGHKLLDIINQTDAEGVYCRLVNLVNGEEWSDSIIFRIFKNNPAYRFEGKIHEQVINSIERAMGTSVNIYTDIKIRHYGYDPSLSDIEEKNKRNIHLLQLTEESKRDGYFYYALGNEYARQGNIREALVEYEKGCNISQVVNGVVPIYYPYLMTQILKSYLQLQRYDDMHKKIRKYKKDCPDFKEIYLFEGLAYIFTSHFAKSEVALLKFQQCIGGNCTYPDNQLEKQYNVDDLLQQVQGGKIEHSEKLVTTIILTNHDYHSLIETIKSINEISYEVMVVAPKGSLDNRDILRQYGAEVVEVKSTDKNQMILNGVKKARGKFIMVLEAGEICSFDTEKKLPGLLEKTPYDGFKVNLYEKNSAYLFNECRIFRNNKKFNKEKSMEKYTSKVEPIDTELGFYKIYETVEQTFSLDDSLELDNIKHVSVLIGSPIHQSPDILRQFLLSLEELDDKDINIGYYFTDDNEDMESKTILLDFEKKQENIKLVCAPKRENHDKYLCDETTHSWNKRLVDRVAEMKNNMIEYAIEENFDYLFLVDSDLVLHPKTLKKLIIDEKDIVSNVFWTKWTPEARELPQVWMQDSYNFFCVGDHIKDQNDINNENIKFLDRLKTPGVYQVGGLGACTLISRESLLAGINFDQIKNISFVGEDRHFCIRAEVLGLGLYVDTYYPAYHIYRESDLDGIKAYKEKNKSKMK